MASTAISSSDEKVKPTLLYSAWREGGREGGREERRAFNHAKEVRMDTHSPNQGESIPYTHLPQAVIESTVRKHTHTHLSKFPEKNAS